MASEWLEAISNALTQTSESVPPGFKTMRQIMKETSFSESYLRRWLQQLVQSGKAERRVFRVPCGAGAIKKTPHYRLKKAVSKKTSGNSLNRPNQLQSKPRAGRRTD